MKKRKREDEKPVSGPPSIKLDYANLPTESRHRLDYLLLEWKKWHAQRFPEGFRPSEVLTGSLRYEPYGALASLPESTLPVLDDRPAPPVNPITRTMWFNVQYERTGEVPAYERAIQRPLKLPQASLAAAIKNNLPPPEPHQDEIMNTPIEEKLIEEPEAIAMDTRDTATVTTTADAVIAFPGVDASDKNNKILIPTVGGGGQGSSKRQRLGQRCFNCGSYAHSLRECWKEYNHDAVEEARKRIQGVGGGNGGAPKRYFLIDEKSEKQQKKKGRKNLKKNRGEKNSTAAVDMNGNTTDGDGGGGGDGNGGSSSGSSSSEEKDGELEESLDQEDLTDFEKLQREFPRASPGVLSSSLRVALGIGPLDAPPWLHAMRAMGVPPAYKQKPREEEIKNIEENDNEVPPPPPPPENEITDSVLLNSRKEEGVLLPVLEDKRGGDTAIIENLTQEKEKSTRLEQAVVGVGDAAEDFIQLPVEEKEEDDSEEEESIHNKRYYAIEAKFPGVNAPIPEGADPFQWGQGRKNEQGVFNIGSGGGGGGGLGQVQNLPQNPSTWHVPQPQQNPQQLPVVQYPSHPHPQPVTKPVPMYSVAVPPPHNAPPTAAAAGTGQPPSAPGMYSSSPLPSYHHTPPLPPSSTSPPSHHQGAGEYYAAQHAQHAYHQQEWYHPQQQHEYTNPPASNYSSYYPAPAPQNDYYGRNQQHHYQQTSPPQPQAPPAQYAYDTSYNGHAGGYQQGGGYYNTAAASPPPAAGASVLPYQPPPAQTQQHNHQFSSSPPPPPPPSEAADRWT